MSAPSLLPWPNPRWKENPYQKVVYGGLKANGVMIRRPPPLFSLLPHAPRSDWLHINWPETLYSSPDPTLRAKQLTRFVGTVRRVKRRGTRILWTVHNEFPHEGADVEFHRAANAQMCELSDLIHVHFPQAGEQLESEYGVEAGAIQVMPHPHYGDYYGAPIPSREARAMLSIGQDTRVILIFGYVRRYKGIEAAVESFRKTTNDRLRLLVVGKAEDEGVVDGLLSAAESDPRLILKLSHVPDADVMPLFSAADAFLFPSRSFFTSGSLMLALTYGLPVIAVPRNHASMFVGKSFFRPWEPDTPDRLTEIMQSLDEWLDGLRQEELEGIRKDFAAVRLSESLSERLRQ